MSATIPRKALIAISSYYGVIYPDGTKTGLFFTEALHPFEVLTQAGFEMDLATETGTYGLDDLSLTDRFLAGNDKAIFENPKHPFNVKLNSQLKKAADLKKKSTGCSLVPPVMPLSMTIRPLEGFRQPPKTSGGEEESSQLYAMDRSSCPE